MNYFKGIINTLCINILKKNKASVLIGYRVEGNLHALNNSTYTYDSIINGLNFLHDGSRFDIPKGKFKLKQ